MSIFYPTAILYAAALGGAAAPVSSSEAASLGGYAIQLFQEHTILTFREPPRKKALTPILAGSICGGLMFLAWTIGFTIYFRKRYKRKERHRLVTAGRAIPKETDLDIPQENVIIPPDPAILLGQCKPGEIIFPERQSSSSINKFRQLLPWSHHGEKHRDKAIVTENISSPVNPYAVRYTSATTEEEDAIVDEMTVPLKV
ncbi:hypothetical protein BYT27DRAFT_7239180 [Phlegmacium glaucopus]|nr:hypothetical protein BYT27DRAFT_7239180 [Phlegmacium glaucopus]